MKCKYNHDGDCCNSGALQYMSKCKLPCATSDPITNGDRIRAMSDDELAAFLADDDRACPAVHSRCRTHVNICVGCWLEWLQRPAEVS